MQGHAMTPQKILTILRHAKADVGSATQDDHDRVLNERGQQAATSLGNYLSRRKTLFDYVLCSTARRTRETLEYLHLEPLPSVDFSEKLYLASPNEMLAVIAAIPAQVDHLLVIGHNPGIYQLCLTLSQRGDEALIDTMALKFPTCSLAKIGFDGDWASLAKAGGQLLEFMTPKVLALQEED